MNTTDLNPYEILGVTPAAKPKDIILAQTRALKDGKYDRAVIMQAMQELTNESKRTEVDVLRAGEPRFDFANEMPAADAHSLLKLLTEDIPILPAVQLTPWKHLISVRPQLEDCPLEPIMPDSTQPAQHYDEPDITFPI